MDGVKGNIEAVDDILEHYGKKGMHWGIRKEEEAVGINKRSKEYIKAIPKKVKRSPEEAQKNIEENFKKLNAKFDPPAKETLGRLTSAHTSVNEKRIKFHENQAAQLQKTIDTIKANPSKWKIGQIQNNATIKQLEKQREQELKDIKDIQTGHLTDFQKKALIGAGAIAVIGIGYYAHKKFGPQPEDFAGKPVDFKTYEKFTSRSYLKTWAGDGYVQPSSFNRSEFTLPEGHTFYRLSSAMEDKFGSITYATHSIEDRNRYLTGAPGIKVSNMITFKSKSSVKIPHLTTVLDSLKEEMDKEWSGLNLTKKVTDTDVIDQYNLLSGKGWDSNIAKSLIKNLKGKGYGGLVDEMDAGVFADSPLVLFGDNFTSKIITPIFNQNDVKREAMANLVELSSRKL